MSGERRVSMNGFLLWAESETVRVEGRSLARITHYEDRGDGLLTGAKLPLRALWMHEDDAKALAYALARSLSDERRKALLAMLRVAGEMDAADAEDGESSAADAARGGVRAESAQP